MPEPRPRYEIFVYSPRFEGVHLRGGRVARGGLRWSDRTEDYPHRGPGPGQGPDGQELGDRARRSEGRLRPEAPPQELDELRREVVECYQLFVSGLLDLTDNLVDGDVVPPPARCATTATTPTWSSPPTRARRRSPTSRTRSPSTAASGSAMRSLGRLQGYDHKQMGITARGAWESVKRHFRELGRDIQTRTVHRCRRWRHVGRRLRKRDAPVAGHAARGRVRPSPHLHRSRPRPATRPTRSVSACSSSRGRAGPTTTTLDLRRRRCLRAVGEVDHDLAEAQAALGARRRHVHARRADVMRASSARRPLLERRHRHLRKGLDESHADVGDKANDRIRVDGRDLRCAVVGEGGNLGVTQRGRIEFARAGAASSPTPSTTPGASTAPITRSTSRSSSTASSPTAT